MVVWHPRSVWRRRRRGSAALRRTPPQQGLTPATHAGVHRPAQYCRPDAPWSRRRSWDLSLLLNPALPHPCSLLTGPLLPYFADTQRQPAGQLVEHGPQRDLAQSAPARSRVGWDSASPCRHRQASVDPSQHRKSRCCCGIAGRSARGRASRALPAMQAHRRAPTVRARTRSASVCVGALLDLLPGSPRMFTIAPLPCIVLFPAAEAGRTRHHRTISDASAASYRSYTGSDVVRAEEQSQVRVLCCSALPLPLPSSQSPPPRLFPLLPYFPARTLWSLLSRRQKTSSAWSAAESLPTQSLQSVVYVLVAGLEP